MCILGKSGSGKSTIFKALNGYFSNFSGEILLNSNPKKPIKTSSVVQGGFFFPGSISENFNLPPSLENNVKIINILNELKISGKITSKDI